MDIDVYL
jgi:hypothetical protein